MVNLTDKWWSELDKMGLKKEHVGLLRESVCAHLNNFFPPLISEKKFNELVGVVGFLIWMHGSELRLTWDHRGALRLVGEGE